ncbi:hypothetical protein DEAC_c18100 [Desulfosporosinus acididurans]|uniref:Uncharacterized protein n=1 Tax=Desulfosporosinus acididurans TaxID=476652 RepID=A0A0J1IP14_9FIRM|nr:hypothetical protein [Desulfosporosinus acididurans]KLU66411.1 hypothetical protein DEAC_c18100 [Desulfosporosinus acididurans]
MKKSNFLGLFLSLSLVLTTFLAMPAFAANGSTSSKISTIPSQMKPGTIIEYDKSNNMVILKDGYVGKDGKTVVLDKNVSSKITLNKITLPSPQAGMEVYYDGLGEPTKITINGVIYTNNATAVISPLTAYTSPTGGVTWYSGGTGQYGDTLGYYSCATDMYNDNCARNTQIKLTCSSTGRLAYFNKQDCGNLWHYNHIVDLLPAAFQDYGFSLSTGVFQGHYVHS